MDLNPDFFEAPEDDIAVENRPSFFKRLLLKSEPAAVRSGRNSSPSVTLPGLGDELGRVDSRPTDCMTSREGRGVQRKVSFTSTELHGAAAESGILGCLVNKVKVFGFGQVFCLSKKGCSTNPKNDPCFKSLSMPLLY